MTTTTVSRRDQILAAAAHLFADLGFTGVSTDDLGKAVGVSGPAVYKHFASKEAVLAELLGGISQRLLAGGLAEVASAADDGDALRRLVAFHVDFALTSPELIRVQDRDLAHLGPEGRRRVRRLQRAYVETWVGVIVALEPGLAPAVARTRAHAVFGLAQLDTPQRRGADREPRPRGAVGARARRAGGAVGPAGTPQRVTASGRSPACGNVLSARTATRTPMGDLFPHSSTAEHSTVNRTVSGSNPDAGATPQASDQRKRWSEVLVGARCGA